MAALHFCMVMDLFSMVVSLNLIPVAAREIRHGNRHSAVGDGGCRQLTEAGPFGGIIDVFIEGQSMMQTVNQTVVHDEVHATVAAHFLGFLFNLHGDGVKVILQELIAHVGRYKTMWVKVLSFG